MKALVLEDYMNLVYADVPEPMVASDEVLVRVKACGICGSDIHGMDGSTGRRIPPMIMGHEASGVIAETGAEVDGWEPGTRVCFDSTVYLQEDWYTKQGLYNLSDGRQVLGVSPGNYKRQGAFAEYIAIPSHILYKLPDTVTFEVAAMVEPVAVAAHALSLTPVINVHSAMVVGAGMIGCFLIRLLKLAGIPMVIAVDTDPSRSRLASVYGSDLFLEPGMVDFESGILERTEGRGVDICFDAVGSNAAVNTAIQHTRRGGSITLVGNIDKQINFPLQDIVTRQIALRGSCAICGEYQAVLGMLEKKEIDVNPLISHIAPLKDGAVWFNRLYQREKGLNKVILVP